MNVYLTATPEYSSQEFDEVLKLLNSVNGAVKFIDGKIIQNKLMNMIFPEYEEAGPLTFDEIWKIINNYRTVNSIEDGDFVALLTPKRNAQRWFSAFNGNNLFVETNDWNLYTDKESKYGIAFSVVENLIQTLMKLDIENLLEEPNIHFEKSIGCINDFCGRKEDIMFKLRDGYICESCKQRIRKEKIDVPVISHLIYLMEYLRNQMVDNFSWLTDVERDQVTVDSNGVLKIGDKIIGLGEQNKSIYFLFLNNIDGIPTKHLTDHQKTLSELYYSLKYFNDDNIKSTRALNKESEFEKLNISETKLKEIRKTVSALVDSDRFRQEKSKINKEIKNIVGIKMSEFYIIDNIKEDDLKLYKLRIEKEYILLDEKFVL